MATVTKPLMLDETGQDILNKLDDILIATPVVDNCSTADPVKALSANQGKVLNETTVKFTSEPTDSTVQINADQLNGHDYSYYATQSELDEVKASSGRSVGELVYSTLPLADAGLHLLDGALITEGGTYDAFVQYMKGLYEDNPTANYFCSESDWQSSVGTYGVCGKFVVNASSVPATVRIPKITGIIEGTTDVTALGNLVQAGLPNITGSFYQSGDMSGSYVSPVDYSGTGAITARAETGTYGSLSTSGNTDGVNRGFNFSAASGEIHNGTYRNNIYGKSDTVQPQTIKCLVYIVLANRVKTEIIVDIDNVQTDLNNINDQLDKVTSWKYLGSQTGGGTTMNLPSSWKRARIMYIYTNDCVIFNIDRQDFDVYTSGNIYYHAGNVMRWGYLYITYDTFAINFVKYMYTSAPSSTLGSYTDATSGAIGHVFWQ